jgi:PAS domain-containing protein
MLRRQVRKKTSELEKAFTDLRRSEEQYRTAVQATRDGLFEIFFPESIMSVSPGFMKSFGFAKARDLRKEEWAGIFIRTSKRRNIEDTGSLQCRGRFISD